MDAEKDMLSRAEALINRMNTKFTSITCGMLKPRLLKCDTETRTLLMTFPAQLWEQNPAGALHGGLIATMLDTTMGALAHSITGDLSPTVNLNVSFLRPGPGSGTLYVQADTVKAGRSVLYISSKMWSDGETEKLIATATGVFHNPVGQI